MPGPCGPSSMPVQPLPSKARLSVMVSDSIDSFILNLSYSKIPIKALLDSGAMHCFIDSSLVSDHCLPAQPLSQPLRLCLFNRSFATNPIKYKVTIPILFAPGQVIPVSFLVTPLDPDISAVIGISWLCQHNPLIDWANNCIHFHAPELSIPSLPITDPESNFACAPPLVTSTPILPVSSAPTP